MRGVDGEDRCAPGGCVPLPSRGGDGAAAAAPPRARPSERGHGSSNALIRVPVPFLQRERPVRVLEAPDSACPRLWARPTFNYSSSNPSELRRPRMGQRVERSASASSQFCSWTVSLPVTVPRYWKVENGTPCAASGGTAGCRSTQTAAGLRSAACVRCPRSRALGRTRGASFTVGLWSSALPGLGLSARGFRRVCVCAPRRVSWTARLP